MIGILIIVVAFAIILGVYTAVGRLSTPAGQREPWKDLGLRGLYRTARKGVRFLLDNSPPGGFRSL